MNITIDDQEYILVKVEKNDPKHGEWFWYVGLSATDKIQIKTSVYWGRPWQVNFRKIGNYYTSKEKAEEMREIIKQVFNENREIL